MTAAYGVRWISNAVSPTLTRMGDNVGKTAGTVFNSIAPWSGMRRCNLWNDGTPTAYYGDRCFTDIDVANMGQCMVQIPAFYHYIDVSAAADGTKPRVTFWIATLGDVIINEDNYNDTTLAYEAGSGTTHTIVAGDLHPAFLVDTTTVKDYLYIGAYEAYLNGTTVESKAGVTPTGCDGVTVPYARSYTQSRLAGNHWNLFTVQALAAVKLLLITEYATLNSQLAVGKGNVDNTVPIVTGSTTASGNASTGTQANQLSAVSYRGIENLWGNRATIMDGYNIGYGADYEIWIAPQSTSGYGSASHTSPYADTGIKIPSATNTTSALDLTVNPWSFLPSAATGGYTQYFCDQNFTGTGVRTASSGGWYSVEAGLAGAAGIFHWHYCATAVADAVHGYRIQYWP